MHSVISLTAIFRLIFYVIAAPSLRQNHARASCVTATPNLYSNHSRLHNNHSGSSFIATPSPRANQNDFSLLDGFPDPDENQRKLIERKIFKTLLNASFPINISKN